MKNMKSITRNAIACLALFFLLIFFVSAATAQTTTCPRDTVTFFSKISGTNYQWKMITDTGFENISDNNIFIGSAAAALQVNNIPSYFTAIRFVCFVDGNFGDTFSIKIANKWTGAVDSSWETPGNWSCGAVPDVYTDVLVENTSINPIVINSDASCKTLLISPNSVLKINDGYNLSIKFSAPIDGLTKEDMAILDNVPSVYIPLDSTFMEDGISVPEFLAGLDSSNFLWFHRPASVPYQTITTPKKILLARMTQMGNYLMNDANFIGYKPHQVNGLVYIPGGKEYTISSQPTQGDCANQGEKYYGLDCSGFIYQMTKFAGLDKMVVGPGSDKEGHEGDYFNVTNGCNPDNWNNAFKRSKYNALNMFNYTKSQIPVDSLRTGDIINWGTHVGMVVDKTIYQCNGDFDKPKCEDGYNRNADHGPIMKSLLEDTWITKLNKGLYSVDRISCIFNQANTPSFRTNNFRTIAVGKDGHIWAGTTQLGFYKYNGIKWEDMGVLSNHIIQDIKPDRDGGIWVAESGSNGATATGGGIYYFPNSSVDGYKYYTPTQNNVPSRYTRSLFIDTTRFNGPQLLPSVWSAHLASTNVQTTGAVGHGLYSAYPEFQKITAGVDISNGLGSCQAIGGNQNEIWVYANANFGKSQILRYDPSTGTQLLPPYDNTSNPSILSTGFIVRSIYFDKNNLKWIGLGGAGSGIIIVDGSNNWINPSLSTLFTPTTIININAITGDRNGNVFIGTTTGLIIYHSGKAIDQAASYSKYTMKDGLPSNNIQGIAVDKNQVIKNHINTLLLATDNGIIFWDPIGVPAK
jgi:hypothetical protein